MVVLDTAEHRAARAICYWITDVQADMVDTFGSVGAVLAAFLGSAYQRETSPSMVNAEVATSTCVLEPSKAVMVSGKK